MTEPTIEERLVAMRIELERGEAQGGYGDDVKIYASTLVQNGTPISLIARALGLSQGAIRNWYEDLFLNTADLAFGVEDFTSYRSQNLVVPDGRTKGCIVKGIRDERITKEQALELLQTVRENITMSTVNSYVNKYTRDCDIMQDHCPPFVEWTVHTPLALTVEHSAEMQAMIFANDRAEDSRARELRAEAIIARR